MLEYGRCMIESENDKARAMTLGADDFMIKPRDFNDFRAAISKAVTKYLK